MLTTPSAPSYGPFVTRTLAEKGYTLKTSGPARYALEAYLLCADTRKASLGLVGEELRLPADAVGPGYSEDIHYWLPDAGASAGQTDKEALVLKFDSEFRSRGQLNAEAMGLFGIDPDRIAIYETNSPSAVFDQIESDVAAQCEAGAPVKLSSKSPPSAVT